MKRHFIWILPLMASLSYAITVPSGTEVDLTFDQGLSSKSAKAGDSVTLHVTRDVIVDGRRILRAGQKVYAVVNSVRHRGRFGVNGRLAFTVEPIRGIPLTPGVAGKQFNSRTDHAAEAAGAGLVILGPIGLAGGLFVEGKQVVIHPGDSLETEVSRTVHVSRI